MAMTQQEIFNQVAHHLLKQNQKSEARDRRCVYRNGELMCAVGALIKEECYDPVIDSPDEDDTSVHNPRVLKALRKSEVISTRDTYYNGHGSQRVQLLMDLQYIHDYFHPDRWKSLLNAYAENHNLQPIT